MERRVFFSFDYSQVGRVNQIRSVPNVIGTAAAGFEDASLWQEAEKKGTAEIERMIDSALEDTSVTVVCVTQGTAASEFVNYAIDRSLARGNGLLGIRIHRLKDAAGETAAAGAAPPQIENSGYMSYNYKQQESLARWIEEAAKRAGR